MPVRATSAATALSSKIVAWFAGNARDLPWRKTRDPYAIWISEIMLQQTQVKTVIPFWERWMRQFPTISALAAAPEEKVLKAWEGLGYYRRARHLHRAAKLLAASAGNFPRSIEAIREIPGVGPYTAGAIASIAYGDPEPILDGNVIRVLTRLFAIKGDPKSAPVRDTLWKLARQFVQAAAPSNRCSELNQGLMELGATLCTPRQPQCGRCPVALNCLAQRKKCPEAFPQSAPRREMRKRQFVAFLLQRDGKVLVRKRPDEQINGGLWEFPNSEVAADCETSHLIQGHALRVEPFATVRHTITNNRITVRAFRGEVNGNADALARHFQAQWRTLAEVGELPFSSAHARLRGLLQGAHGARIRGRRLEHPSAVR